MSANSEHNEVDFFELISEAWTVFREHPMEFAVGTLIIVVLQSAMNYFFIAGLLLTGPMIMGLFKMALSAVRRQEVRLGDVFIGFDYFVSALLMNLAIVLVSLVGLPFCGIPALFIYAMFLPSYFFLLDGSQGLTEALSMTREMLRRDLRTWILIGLYVLVLFLSGLAFAGLGLVLTVPILTISLARIYDRYRNGQPFSGELPGGDGP